MNSLKKRLISLMLLTCVALTSAVSCSAAGGSSKETATEKNVQDAAEEYSIEIITNDEGNPVKFPFQSGSTDGGNISNIGFDLDAPDPQSIDSSPKAQQSEPSTEAVTVVDDKGEPVTDNNGEAVTEYVTVENAAPADSEYKSATASKYTFWLDISKDKDYTIDGQFIKLKFKMKDNIPDGDYPITITPDLSTINGVSLDADTVAGTIRVGGSPIEQQNVAGNTSRPVIYGDNVNAQKGDTVELYLNLNQPIDICACILWVSYDSNAMEEPVITPVGKYAEATGSNLESGKK